MSETRVDHGESEAGVLAFAAAISDWVWECDADLRLTYVSDEWQEKFGFSTSDKGAMEL